MDKRIAMKPGTLLPLETGTGCIPCTIGQEIGRGGSCIVYEASIPDRAGNQKLIHIKECYPLGLRMTREENGRLSADARDAQAFAQAQQRMTGAYQKNHELFSAIPQSNAIANASDICTANGTIYILSSCMNGRTFSAFQGETLHDCIALMIGIANALLQIHEAGYLYLDLKPDNILTLNGSLDLVQLFDFDSMVSLAELKANRPVSFGYTKGFAPLEQQLGRAEQLGCWSDLFSLGAVLFYALWHRTPNAFDCAPDAVYDAASMGYAPACCRDGLWDAITSFFHHTLADYPLDRYQHATEAIAQLKRILALADDTVPWVRSAFIQPPPVFYGRDAEMKALHELLCRAEHGAANLYGLGGMGKSSLVRQYLCRFKAHWETAVWICGSGSLADCLTDDTNLWINTLRPHYPEESPAEYLQRKLQALSLWTRDHKTLLVIDNFEKEQLEQLAPLARVGWTMLLISRSPLPEGLYPALQLQQMPEGDLERLFSHYARQKLQDEASLAAFRRLSNAIHGHTLLTELIARQIAASHLALPEAEKLVAAEGIGALPEIRLDYIRDQSAVHAGLMQILDRLVERESFSPPQRLCLKLLALFDAQGIEEGLFLKLQSPVNGEKGIGREKDTAFSSAESTDGLSYPENAGNRWSCELADSIAYLENGGWLKLSNHMLLLHPLMQQCVRAWPWLDAERAAAEGMMLKLYEMIRPSGTRHDGSKQFSADYGHLYSLLGLARQLLAACKRATKASRLLQYRLLMDAPVDQDAAVLQQMLVLLQEPGVLPEDCVLRLYETAAYLHGRLGQAEEAVALLKQMRRYLTRHPSAYYLSAYHRAMAIILHNADEYENLKACLRHEDKAIAAARLSHHPDAPKQLAACLLNKATSLLSADVERKLAMQLIEEARPLIEQHTAFSDEESYQYQCIAAMGCAMTGDKPGAENHLAQADRIASGTPDSDLALFEHLTEQAAPILITLGEKERSAAVVRQAISLCEGHTDMARYREACFDAYLLLAHIEEMNGAFGKAKAAYDEAEKRVADSREEWKLPLCPPEIRQKAAEEQA